MKARQIQALALQIPFKESFKHASHDRQVSESFVVRIQDSDLSGFGESCPRVYVTGETLSSCKEFLTQHIDMILEVKGIEGLRAMQEAAESQPAAWCAIELAYLDYLARQKKISVEQMLNCDAQRRSHSMTAILGISDWSKTVKRILRFRLSGFKDFKVKISGKLSHDLSVIKFLHRTGVGRNRIRIDANNFFPDLNAATEYLSHFNNFVWAVEEPLPSKKFEALKELSQVLMLKIILDESFTNKSDLKILESNKLEFIPNIRISKLGGVLRTLEFLKTILDFDGRFVLGSHVGETSLLARASLLIANNFSSHMLGYECGYGPYLLQSDPFSPQIGLSFGGKMNGTFSNKGWGLAFDPHLNKELK